MNAIFQKLGQLSGLLGILLMLVSVGARLAGNYTLGAYATGTLMLAGIAAVSVGCFLLLWGQTARGRD